MSQFVTRRTSLDQLPVWENLQSVQLGCAWVRLPHLAMGMDRNQNPVVSKATAASLTDSLVVLTATALFGMEAGETEAEVVLLLQQS